MDWLDGSHLSLVSWSLSKSSTCSSTLKLIGRTNSHSVWAADQSCSHPEQQQVDRSCFHPVGTSLTTDEILSVHQPVGGRDPLQIRTVDRARWPLLSSHQRPHWNDPCGAWLLGSLDTALSRPQSSPRMHFFGHRVVKTGMALIELQQLAWSPSE